MSGEFGDLPPIPVELKKLRAFFVLARRVAKGGKPEGKICSYLLRQHAVFTGARMPAAQGGESRAFIMAALDQLEREKPTLPPHTGEEELEILQVYAFKNFKLAEAPDLQGNANKATAIIYLNAAKMFDCLVATAGKDSQHIPVDQFVMLKNACMTRSVEIVRALKEGRRPAPPEYANGSAGAAGGGGAAAGAVPGGGGIVSASTGAPPAASNDYEPQFGGGGNGNNGSAPAFSPAPAPAPAPAFSPSPAPSFGSNNGGYVPTFGGPPVAPPAPAPAPAHQVDDDDDFFASMIPAAPTGMPGSAKPTFSSSSSAAAAAAAPSPAAAAKPTFVTGANNNNGPPAHQSSSTTDPLAPVMASVAKAKASDAARNYGDALEEYKVALQQILFAHKNEPGLSADSKANLMQEARRGMTRAEQIKVELTTLPPALPTSTLDPLLSVQLPDSSTVRLVSGALNQDLKGNLGNALEVYKSALQSLMGAMKATSHDPRTKGIVVSQLKLYMSRAEQLKAWLRERGRKAD